jgi:transposase InsO family protein
MRPLSTQEQRFQAVSAVLGGARIGEIAAKIGVSRQSVHAWLVRYHTDGLDGLRDGSHRPDSCPHQVVAAVEQAVCDMRRDHPRWGPHRIAFELGRNGCPGRVPSKATVYRILLRHGLAAGRRRRRRREDYVRWQREKPMELWQMDIVGGVLLPRGKEAKVVTGVDDHSRFCVMASVVARATGRAVCLSFAQAMRLYGIPEEVLTDNGKQFTDRFGKGGEVLFDRICRTNGIIHRLTQPASPTTTGKIERFHLSLRRELLDHSGVFPDLAAAQAAVDAWVEEYNTRRPHQALDMAVPAERFLTAQVQADQAAGQDLIPLRLPAFLTDATTTLTGAGPQPAAPPAPAVSWPQEVPLPAARTADRMADSGPQSQRAARERNRDREAVFTHAAVEFDRVVPPAGNLAVQGRQFWLGPRRAGQVIRFWADTSIIHISIAGVRIKSFRSHLTVSDLAVLTRLGARPADPAEGAPTTAESVPPLEAHRVVNSAGWIVVGSHRIQVAERRAGMRVGIRIDGTVLAVFDPETRHLLRTHRNPLSGAQMIRLSGAFPAGPPPQPATGPVTVQRRIGKSGDLTVCKQRVHLGREHAHKVVTVHVGDDTLTIELDDGDRVFHRTTTLPVYTVKAHDPHVNRKRPPSPRRTTG